MKLKDITESSGRWSTPLGTMDAHAAVADGVLVDLSMGTSIIGLAVQNLTSCAGRISVTHSRNQIVFRKSLS